jgi:glycosyltransferase involved in cell wall biosynthesis
VRIVVVTGRKQALSVTFPDNVEVRREAPARECMCLLRGSLFSIVPIVSDITGAGHMTLVSAMQLGKAQVVTNYDTVKDYFFGGVHGVWVEPGSVSSMRQGIQRLLNDDVFRRSCGERAKAFADRWLCEAATVRFAQRLMDAWLEGRTYDTEPQGWGDAKQEWV